MSGFNYTTLEGAKYYYRSLAADFMMKKWVFERIEKCQTLSELEHFWYDALATI